MEVDMCRVCLASGASIPIFDNTISCDDDICSKLNKCLGEEIQDVPGFPRSLCDACNMTLNEIVSFINKYKESCKVIEEKLINKLIKKEHEETYEHEDYSEPEVEFGNSLLKTEISGNELLYEEPIVLEIEYDKVHERKSKPSKNRIRKKNDSRLSRVAASILEGEFVFEKGEQWRFIPDSKEKNPAVKIKKIKTPKIKAEEKPTGKKLNKKEKVRRKVPALCEICGKSFVNSYNLYHHKTLHQTDSKKFSCSTCSKIFTSARGLKRHKLRTHVPIKRLQCSLCEKTYSDKRVLNNHFKAVHLNEERKYKKYPCSFCGKLYTTSKSCLIHERSAHTGERPAVCSICNASFYEEDYLKQHMRLHTGETPFKCPVCGRGYAQNGNMKSHLKHNHRISQLDEETRKSIHPKFFKYMKP